MLYLCLPRLKKVVLFFKNISVCQEIAITFFSVFCNVLSGTTVCRCKILKRKRSRHFKVFKEAGGRLGI